MAVYDQSGCILTHSWWAYGLSYQAPDITNYKVRPKSIKRIFWREKGGRRQRPQWLSSRHPAFSVTSQGIQISQCSCKTHTITPILQMKWLRPREVVKEPCWGNVFSENQASLTGLLSSFPKVEHLERVKPYLASQNGLGPVTSEKCEVCFCTLSSSLIFIYSNENQQLQLMIHLIHAMSLFLQLCLLNVNHI